MTVHHRVPDDLLTAYAAGDLDEGFSLVIATHLALCPESRATVEKAEAVGGALLEGIEPEPVSANALDSIMARIDGVEPARKPESKPVESDEGTVFPEPLRSYAGGDLESLKWKNLAGGAKHIPLVRGDGTARLLFIPAGMPVPEHTHKGRELTLVLKGSFQDSRGTFSRGDVQDCDDTVHHQPVAGVEEDCICLTVTEAPLRFSSLPVRIAQPFMGI